MKRRVHEHPIPHSRRSLAREALSPVLLRDVIAYLGQNHAVNALHSEPAVADHLPGLSETHRPESEAENRVSADILLYPPAHALLVEGVRVVTHYIRVREHIIQRVIIVVCHLTENQAVGFCLHFSLFLL